MKCVILDIYSISIHDFLILTDNLNMTSERGYGHLVVKRSGGGALSRVYGGSPHIIDARLRNKRLEETIGSREDAIQYELRQQLKAIEKRKSSLEKELQIASRGLRRSSQWDKPRVKKAESRKTSAWSIDYIPTAYERDTDSQIESGYISVESDRSSQLAKTVQLRHRRSSSLGDAGELIQDDNKSIQIPIELKPSASSEDVFETNLEVNAKKRLRTPPPLLRRLSRSHNDIDDLEGKSFDVENRKTNAFDILVNETLDKESMFKDRSFNVSSDDIPLSSTSVESLDDTDFLNNSMRNVKQMNRRHSRVVQTPGITSQKLKLPQRPHTAYHYRAEKEPMRMDEDYDSAVRKSDCLMDKLSTSPNPESELKNDFPNRVKVFLSQYDEQSKTIEREE